MMISHKYEVLAEIGRGGMGIVYKVRHTTLKTVSALKILPAHLADDQELITRFHREARVMAQLHHPNIVRVIDVDKSEDLHYFVMEYVDGQSLSSIIADEGACSLSDTLDIVGQVTRALAYAHARSPAVIHRDIKPSNILVETDTRRAVVTDFGLAKLAGGAESLRTESGKFIGTLRYCAPEQLVGVREVDGRIDVYALGMVLYETYAGRSPYVDLERPQVIAGLLQLTVAHPFHFDAKVPTDFRQLVLRATAKNRDERYPTVAAFLGDLERLRSMVSQPTEGGTVDRSRAASTPPLPRPVGRSFSRVIALGTTAAVGLAVGGGILMWGSVLRGRERLGSAVLGVNASPAPSPPGSLRKAVQKAEEGIRSFISVMDFSPGTPDPRFNWMRDAIRDNLNSQLSSAPDCKVFSKEFIDFKAQQMVREGQYQDVKAATMEVAQKLGVTKAVLGSYRADRDTLHIEAHIVDMETGVQEASETVEGDQDNFADLQASLARKLMTRLGVTPPAAETATLQAAGSPADLENYRLLLQAEGQGGGPEPTPTSTNRRGSKDRHGRAVEPGYVIERVVSGGARLFQVSAAFALDTREVPLSAEDQIRETLERYRHACEQKDLSLLREVYQGLSPAQVEANRRYFANARDLAVSFEDIDVAVGRDEAAVSYTRRDRFIDNETDRPTKVDVRITKILVNVDGTWKILSGPVRK